MALINPINVKAFIEKPIETFCKRVRRDKHFRDKLRIIHKSQALPLDKFIQITDSKEMARVERAKEIMVEVKSICKSIGRLQSTN